MLSHEYYQPIRDERAARGSVKGFSYTYDGLPISRAAMVAAFGARQLSDVIEVIAAGGNAYTACRYRVTFTR